MPSKHIRKKYRKQDEIKLKQKDVKLNIAHELKKKWIK